MTGIDQVNKNLESFRAVHNFMDAWLVLEVEDIDVVYNWRLESEHRMRSLQEAELLGERKDGSLAQVRILFSFIS